MTRTRDRTDPAPAAAERGGASSETTAESTPVGDPMPAVSAGGVCGGRSPGVGDVLAGVCSARELVAMASQAPLEGAGEQALREVVAAGGRLRSAVEALLLAATAALEAARAGAGRAALRDEARLGARAAARKATVGSQLAQMPNVAGGLARGELTAEHAEVLADAARRTSPDAVDTAQGLLDSAASVSPEVLRRDVQAFAARWDPAAAEGELRRQRRDRSAALFTDDDTAMGVLNARFDPVSFALVRQAVESYNDALWRLDGGRDGTPAQVRDNRQRLADSIFEMLTGRNALHTQQHPAPPADNSDGPNSTNPAHTATADHTGAADHDGIDLASTGAADRNTNNHAGTAGRNSIDLASVGAAGRNSAADHDGIDLARTGATDHGDLPGRSVTRFAPAQAPNQLVIVADIGVIDGTDPGGRCDVLGAGPVPASILNTLSPDTRITAALFAGPGRPLWLGRNRRHATAAQQLVIAIRDRGCVLCGAPMHRCDYHHIDEWDADDGPTDVPNLAALCGDCHNSLHKSKRRLRRNDPDRADPPDNRYDPQRLRAAGGQNGTRGSCTADGQNGTRGPRTADGHDGTNRPTRRPHPDRPDNHDRSGGTEQPHEPSQYWTTVPRLGSPSNRPTVNSPTVPD